jgi:hypothetical protein
VSKSAGTAALNNLYYFNNKTQKFDLTYDQITRAAKFIIRANERNKTLGNKQGKTLLTAIADKIKNSKNGEIFIDHDWISTITDCKTDQNTKIMGQLTDILDFKYHRCIVFEGKKRHYGLIVKFTSDGKERLMNPELFYDVPSPQTPQKHIKPTPKKIGVIAEKNRPSYKDIRDFIEEDKKLLLEFLSSQDIILKQEINNIITPAREAKDAPSAFSSLELAKDASDVPKPDPIPANNNETYEKPIMNEKETLTVSDRKMLLSKALLGAFGQEEANLLQDNCEFIELEADKVKITIGSKKNLSDLEKEKIRKSLKSVYGEDVRIVTSKEQLPQPIKPPTPELLTNVRANNSEWFTFRQNLIRVLTKRHEEKIAQHIVKNWFDKLGVSELSNSQKLVMIAEPFYIHWIENNYDHVVEEAVCLGNFTVELHYKGNNERPRVYCKELIKRGKK